MKKSLQGDDDDPKATSPQAGRNQHKLILRVKQASLFILFVLALPQPHTQQKFSWRASQRARVVHLHLGLLLRCALHINIKPSPVPQPSNLWKRHLIIWIFPHLHHQICFVFGRRDVVGSFVVISKNVQIHQVAGRKRSARRKVDMFGGKGGPKFAEWYRCIKDGFDSGSSQEDSRISWIGRFGGEHVPEDCNRALSSSEPILFLLRWFQDLKWT